MPLMYIYYNIFFKYKVINYVQLHNTICWWIITFNVKMNHTHGTLLSNFVLFWPSHDSLSPFFQDVLNNLGSSELDEDDLMLDLDLSDDQRPHHGKFIPDSSCSLLFASDSQTCIMAFISHSYSCCYISEYLAIVITYSYTHYTFL